ncbi:hypothetical protein Tco_0418760 [Tanacetum coccineum]
MMYERPPTTLFQNPPRTTTFPFQRYTLVFQQHQDESIYDAWTRFKYLIQRVPHHGLDLWSLTQLFYDHVDDYTRMDLNIAADGNLMELSVANLKAQAKRLFGNENVWVEMHRGIAWDMVENPNPQSTPQVLPSDVSLCGVKGGFQPERLGLEVGSIRRIQGIGYGVLEFLGVGTTFDIFQNLHILYLQYGVLVFSGYGVLSLFPLWSLVSAGTDTPYLP